MGVEIGERERKGGSPQFERMKCWWIMEEREGEVKKRIFLLLAHGLKSGVTGQTGDRPRSSQ
jgi:hypothetical protein